MSEEITNQAAEELSEEQLSELLRIRRDKLTALQEVRAGSRLPSQIRCDGENADIRARFDQLENTGVTIAGRMMSRRIHGQGQLYGCT